MHTPGDDVVPIEAGAADSGESRVEVYVTTDTSAAPHKADEPMLYVMYDAAHPEGDRLYFTEAEWEACTAHAKTQEHLLEIIMSILAVPIRRPRWDWPLTPVGLLFIRPIESDRRGILGEPWGRDSLDRQGMERDRTIHAIEMRSKQGIEDLSQPIIMERGSREAGLEQG